MLKSELKAVALIFVFCFLMLEYLTWSTLGLAALGSALVYFEVKVAKKVRSLLALLVFASYWFIYGKVIDPEIGLNFLTMVIILKLLERETLRDRYMIFFGMLLLLSAGSLFEKNLTYVGFYLLAFVVLIHDFYSELKIRWRLKELSKATLWVFPLTIVLFLLVPRLLNPFAFKQSAPGPGELGYSPDLNIREVEKLTPNDTPVFQALVPGPLDQLDLYWRGNTLDRNDGWNWSAQRAPASAQGEDAPSYPQEINQQIRLFNREEFLFALDGPNTFHFRGKIHLPGAGFSLPQRSWQSVSQYEVRSLISDERKGGQDSDPHLQVILSRKDQEWIHENFRGSSVEELGREVRSFFGREQFSYSLSPGRISSFRDFMEKKVGFCGHYSSALALILRAKGIPSRLVSGFMGGSYNRYGEFYLITQNDAHVWVEARENGVWKRLDPTAWIAPERVTLGGEAFMAVKEPNALARMGFQMNFALLQDMRLWFNQWDVKFYRWLDQFDYFGQLIFLSKLKLNRSWLFTLLPLLVAGFGLLYAWFMARREQKNSHSELEELWLLFFKKAGRRGFRIGAVSIAEVQMSLEEHPHRDGPRLREILRSLSELSFKRDDDFLKKKLKKEIRKL